MTAGEWIAIASVIVTGAVALMSVYLNIRTQRELEAERAAREGQANREANERDEIRRREDLEREHQGRLEIERQQERKDELERIHAPQIQFDVSARFFHAAEAGTFVEVRLNVWNRGRVRQELHDPVLRIRGLGGGAPLKPRADKRLDFPIEVLRKRSVLPRDLRFFFVEPGVEQDISFVTAIPDGARFVLVYAEFSYDKYTPHSTERVFAVDTHPRDQATTRE